MPEVTFMSMMRDCTWFVLGVVSTLFLAWMMVKDKDDK